MYDLSDYEDVATLNRWFIENYPMGRSAIITEFHDPDKGFIRMRAEVYRDALDPFPAAMNVGNGVRDLYNKNMARYYVEDTATSALGRAIILLKGSKKTATRESMEEVSKVKANIDQVKAKMAQTSGEYIPVAKADDPWTIAPVQQAQTIESAVEMVKEILGGTTDSDIQTCVHGEMVWKTGTGKTGKQWGHWRCIGKILGEAERCEPRWYEITADGTWKPQVKRG